MARMREGQFGWVTLRLNSLRCSKLSAWKKKYNYREDLSIDEMKKIVKRRPKAIGEAFLEWDAGRYGSVLDFLKTIPQVQKATATRQREFVALTELLEKFKNLLTAEADRVLDGLRLNEATAADGQTAINEFGKFWP